MNIACVASEVIPFAKTGGLADVAGTIPKEISALGENVSVFMPLYRSVREAATSLKDERIVLAIPIGDKIVRGNIFRSKLPDSSVTVYFIENDDYYDREYLYSTPKGDYEDNCERFVFLCRGILEAMKKLEHKIDVIHCNDWQSGLVPVYLKTVYKDEPLFANTKTVFTVHNLAYQGVFWHWDMKLAGLDWSLFNWKQLEHYGNLNLLKGGLVFADAITTVSEAYAREIQTEEYGCGLEGVLKERSSCLSGIVNGIDYAVWNPETDPLIPAHYDKDNTSGKEECKRHLQEKSGLEKSSVPLFGIISRLVSQKGFDILAEAMEEMMQLDLQLVILGTGEEQYHDLLRKLGEKFSEKLSVNITFDNTFAHEIEAGADVFMMPSRYEPCGLNQLFSLKYGTVPLVRMTGGLIDTIVNCTPETLHDGTANGVAFTGYSANDLIDAVKRTIELYASPEDWRQLIINGMSQDWSWQRSAKKYVELYKQVVG